MLLVYKDTAYAGKKFTRQLGESCVFHGFVARKIARDDSKNIFQHFTCQQAFFVHGTNSIFRILNASSPSSMDTRKKIIQVFLGQVFVQENLLSNQTRKTE